MVVRVLFNGYAYTKPLNWEAAPDTKPAVDIIDPFDALQRVDLEPSITTIAKCNTKIRPLAHELVIPILLVYPSHPLRHFDSHQRPRAIRDDIERRL